MPPERKPLSELQTKIIVREEDLPPRDEDTQAPTIVPLDKDGSMGTTERAPSERMRRDTQPSARVVVDPHAADFDEGEESTTGTTLPLSDEDLEPGTES